MDSKMIEAVQTGNIDALHELIQGDPYVLEQFDKVPFLDTPLHLAACTEHLTFVLEIMNLKPSFAIKLNPAGFSPMHLALQYDKTPTVLWLLRFDKSLVRVKGKEGMTPLHHVVQFENLDILIEFLEVCPEAIEDVTVRGETAFHIALKHDKFEAFKVLVGWLRRSCHEAAQSWEKELLLGGDIEGNTILHIAVIKKRPEEVKLLLENFSHDHIIAKNLKGSTPLEIAEDKSRSDNGVQMTAVDIERSEHKMDESQSDNRQMTALDFADLQLERHKSQEIYDMLKSTRGLIRSSHCKKPYSSSLKSLQSKMSCYSKFKTAIARARSGISEQMCNTFLVVTVLIITATYSASLNPPKKEEKPETEITSPMDLSHYNTTNVIVSLPDVYSLFWMYNTLTFWASVLITAFLLPSRSICLLLLITLSLFGACYMLLIVAESWNLEVYFTGRSNWYFSLSIVNYILSFLLALLVAYRIAYYVCLKLGKGRRVRILLVSFSIIAALTIFPAMLFSEVILQGFRNWHL